MTLPLAGARSGPPTVGDSSPTPRNEQRETVPAPYKQLGAVGGVVVGGRVEVGGRVVGAAVVLETAVVATAPVPLVLSTVVAALRTGPAGDEVLAP